MYTKRMVQIMLICCYDKDCDKASCSHVNDQCNTLHLSESYVQPHFCCWRDVVQAAAEVERAPLALASFGYVAYHYFHLNYTPTDFRSILHSPLI
jgi:hypothetical protein